MARDLTDLSRVIRRIEAKSRTRPPAGSPRLARGAARRRVEETERGRVLVVRRRFPVDHRHGAQSLLAAREAAPLAAVAPRPRRRRGGPRPTACSTSTPRPPAWPAAPAPTRSWSGWASSTATTSRCASSSCATSTRSPRSWPRSRRSSGASTASSPTTAAASTCRCSRRASCSGAGACPGRSSTSTCWPPARRLWSDRLADCRLGTVEQHALGFTRDDDLPGALIPSVYFEYLRRKRAGRAAARVRAQPPRHPLARRADRLGRGRGGARADPGARAGGAGRARPAARS